jgi:CO dehydrogenase/acetyl-CoA synthase delta subunit
MAGDRTSQELYLNPREDLMIDTTTAALGYIILF